MGGLWLLNLVRWARRTRPEPLPEAPAGSTTVTMRDGTVLHAQVGGVEDAPVTVVMVHGFLARTIEFDMQWNSLGHRVRTVRYDHRSHGRSDHNAGPLKVEDLADDLAQVISQLVPDGPVVLIGHSMGGMTVLTLAIHHRDLFDERVRGVALLATGAGHFISSHSWENAFRWISRKGLLGPALLALRLAAPALEQIRPRRTHVMRWSTRKVCFGTGDIDPATLAMTHQLLEEPSLRTLTSLQGSLLRNDTRHGLPALKNVPVLVMTGTEDRLTRPEHSVEMARDLGAGATLVMIPGAGHVLNQTRPVQVNAELHRLLDRVDAAADHPHEPQRHAVTKRIDLAKAWRP
ncbi:MAG: Alpha/beta hydrolase [Frankiales bacterium]|nr:Alpha/beta hydrolase [Frankiales bacterium]